MKPSTGFMSLFVFILWNFNYLFANSEIRIENFTPENKESKVLAESIIFEIGSHSVKISQGTTGSIGNYVSTSDSKSIDVYLTAQTGNTTPTWINVNGNLLNNYRYTSGSEIGFNIDAVNLSVGNYNTTITATAPGYASATIQVELIVTSEPVVPLANLKINFQNESAIPPAGWLKDFGQAYGNRAISGPELDYGWKNILNGQPVNLTDNGRFRNTPEDILLATFMHMQGTSVAGFSGTKVDGIWEAKVPNGNYLIRVNVGDGTEADSRHTVNIEGHNLIYDFVPTINDRFKSGSFAFTLSDEVITIDAIEGFNTKINSVTIEPYTGTRPYIISIDIENGETDVDIHSSIATTSLKANNGIKNSTLTPTNVKLIDLITNEMVPANINGSAAGDVIVIVPQSPLKPNTRYHYMVTDGVTDEDGVLILPYSSYFTTGAHDPGSISTQIKFQHLKLPNTRDKHTTLTIGPDNKLYGLTYEGKIKRYLINGDGTLSDPQVILSLQQHQNNQPRLAIGFEFDPASTADNLVVWVTHSSFAFDYAPSWDGKLSELSGANLENVQDILINLPRSYKDHVTNSIAFGPDGALYINQGSNSAMGRRDAVWGNRDETILSAAVLRLDLDLLSNFSLPLDVKTSDGGGNYNPYSPGAPLTLYGTGIRNAYDLLWHSNGELYIPTNGSNAGGNTPASVNGTLRPDGTTYNGPNVPALSNVPGSQKDYLYRVKPGGYYGHPNPKRGEFVINGGNPTAQVDPDEVPAYPVGTLPDANYRGISFDFDLNVSPNGVIEYKNDKFDGALKGKILVVRYSKNDDIIVLEPGGPHLDIINSTEGSAITGFSLFNDPLDLIEDTRNGNIYVSEYGGDGQITLLRPVEGTGVVNNLSELIFSSVKAVTTSPQNLTITNSGNGLLEINEINIEGPNPSLFKILNKPALPKVLSPEESLVLDITFAPANSNVGAFSAELVVKTDDFQKPTVTGGLFGLSANGLEGNNEPTLNNIVKTLGYNINVGGTDLVLSTEPILIGDEISASLFIKAGSGDIEFTPVARYSPLETVPFGYYTNQSGNISLNQIGELSGESPQHQTLLPAISSGQTTFDPGSGRFGFYTKTSNSTQTNYTEDALNPGIGPMNLQHLVRVYPLKDRQGTLIPNSYLVAFEEAYNGDYQDFVFVIKNVKPATNLPPSLDVIPNPAAIAMNSPEQSINLSGISAGPGESQIITISATSSNPELVPDPTVEYQSPNSTGTLTYLPVAGKSGTAEITILVEDNGSQIPPSKSSLTRIFTITVSGPDNKAPTLDPISSPAPIDINAPQQVVNLTGISAGAGETQTLTVTATSDNTELIPDPTVSYSSPNETGSVSYTPVANAYGTANITVTVTDSGPGEAPNVNKFSQTFIVEVRPSSSAPFINDIPGQYTDMNATLGPITFTIGDNDNDLDDLIITATSSDQNLVKDSNIILAGTGTNRTFTIIPETDKTGSLLITITISDGIAESAKSFTLNIGTVTSIGNENLKGKLVLYPNPADSEIEILLENNISGTVRLHLLDLVGKVHQSIVINKQQDVLIIPLNLKLLPKGTYLIQVNQNDVIFTKRLIKL
ncbi:hypothetical protein BH23BAC1_BH23BAC1_35050 [soil metagenome]